MSEVPQIDFDNEDLELSLRRPKPQYGGRGGTWPATVTHTFM